MGFRLSNLAASAACLRAGRFGESLRAARDAFRLPDGVLEKSDRAASNAYLREALEAREKFDLIVCDPPSFSNSKKMQGVLDVQRDHAWLIESCLALLNPGGVLYFSNNLRSFRMDESLAAQCQDISAQSVPEDFRNKKIHQCFRFAK